MIIFDYFFYIVYRFSKNKLGRDNDNALFSATCILSTYISFFIIGTIGLVGIIRDNPFSETVVSLGHAFVMPLAVIVLLISYIRYFKIIGDINLKIETREQYKSGKNMRKLIYFILITVPIFYFVCFRIYYTQHT